MSIDLEWIATYPTNSDDWIRTVLIGGLLTLASVLVVPAFPLYGYLLRVLRGGMTEAAEPPVFDDWGTLFREGIVAFAIVIVYQLIPLLVMAVTVGGSLAAIATGSDAGATAGVAGLLGGLALSALLALVFGYVTLIGVANYAHTGRAGAAFDLDVIRAVAVDGAYAVPWLYGVVALIAANVVAGVLNVVPILGAIVGVFVFFYAQMIAAWLWGKGFGDATGAGGDRPSESGAEAAV
jgi:hypothetical protein